MGVMMVCDICGTDSDVKYCPSGLIYTCTPCDKIFHAAWQPLFDQMDAAYRAELANTIAQCKAQLPKKVSLVVMNPD